MQQPAQLQTRARTLASGWYLAGRALVDAAFEIQKLLLLLLLFSFIYSSSYSLFNHSDGLAAARMVAPFLKGM